MRCLHGSSLHDGEFSEVRNLAATDSLNLWTYGLFTSFQHFKGSTAATSLSLHRQLEPLATKNASPLIQTWEVPRRGSWKQNPPGRTWLSSEENVHVPHCYEMLRKPFHPSLVVSAARLLEPGTFPLFPCHPVPFSDATDVRWAASSASDEIEGHGHHEEH